MEAIKPISRIFAFGHSPSVSSLPKRLLEKHPQLDVLDNSFREAYTVGPERLERHNDGGVRYSDARSRISPDETYQKAFDRLQKSMKQAENKGKRPLFTEDAYMIFRPDITSANLECNRPLMTIPIPVIMTSKVMPTNYRCPLRASNSPQSSDATLFTATYSIFHPITEGLGIHTIESRPPNANPTVLPDAFLKSVTPICVIRHPAHTVPSLYRTAHFNVHGPEFQVQASLRWCRLLVDWYATTTGTEPIVLDGYDLIHKPEIVKKLCGALSLDGSEVQILWNTISQAEIQGQISVKATAQTSSGTQRSRAGDEEIDLDEEEKGWVKEFGVDAATAIMGLMGREMNDYSYLKQYAIK